MKMQTAVVILILIALAGPVAADPLPLAKPEDVGVSSQRLERIGQTLRADIEKGRMPGAVVAIARKGKLIYYEAHGYLDKAAGIPMPKDAIFSIASMTKPMTGVAVMMLVEEGRLFLRRPRGAVSAPARQDACCRDQDRCRWAGYGENRGREAPDDHPGSHAPHLRPDLRGTRRHGGSQDVPGILQLIPHAPIPGLNSSKSWGPCHYCTIPEQCGTTASPSTCSVSLSRPSPNSPSARSCDVRVFKPLGMKDTSFVSPRRRCSATRKLCPRIRTRANRSRWPIPPSPPNSSAEEAVPSPPQGTTWRFGQMLLNPGQLDEVHDPRPQVR